MLKIKDDIAGITDWVGIGMIRRVRMQQLLTSMRSLASHLASLGRIPAIPVQIRCGSGKVVVCQAGMRHAIGAVL